MEPRAKRILITLIVLSAAAAIVALVLTARPPKPTTAPATSQELTAATETEAGDRAAQPEQPDAADQKSSASSDSTDTTEDDGTATARSEASSGSPASDVDVTLTSLDGLVARAPIEREAGAPTLGSIGSLNPDAHRYQVGLTTRGASVTSIVFSDTWNYAAQRRQALAHLRALERGDADPPPMPSDDARLTLASTQLIETVRTDGTINTDSMPVLAMHSIIVNGKSVNLLDFNTAADGSRTPIWSLTGPGHFETNIVNSEGTAVLRVIRTWSLSGNTYDLTLTQQVLNLTDQPMTIEWRQWGPPQLEPTGAPYIDPRRFRFGYMLSQARDPQRLADVNPGKDMMLALGTVVGQSQEASELLRQSALMQRTTPEEQQAHGAVMSEYNDLLTLWPNRQARSEQYELSWFASTNRYFALAIHPHYAGSGPVDRSLARNVADLKHQHFVSPTAANRSFIVSFMTSQPRALEPRGTADFSLGVYAGPMDRAILNDVEPYRALNLGGLIIYQMSDFCAFCTFQWLAHLLIWFLAAAYAITFDWGIAIILLVFTVRLILHPLTKKAQVSMHRTMKAMAKFKPEMEKLQKKYANDKQKLQMEQLKLMREHGVNPFGCLGFLPMFLQMPIWIALYAMLFFAFELRQEPAFWGFFQMFGGWQFLADLSQADHFFYEFSAPFHPFGWQFFTMTGINILPLLMGAVFFVQQKYMTPPTAATLSKEQQQQQKIMRVMMIVLFPIMLYNAPSGLTLYIMTSSILGIIESKMIRKHAERLEAEAELRPREQSDGPPWGAKDKKRKLRDPRGRAYAQMLERLRERKKEPPRTFKKRRKDE